MTRYRIALTRPDRPGTLYLAERGVLTGCKGRAALYTARGLPGALAAARHFFPELAAAEEVVSNGEDDEQP